MASQTVEEADELSLGHPHVEGVTRVVIPANRQSDVLQRCPKVTARGFEAGQCDRSLGFVEAVTAVPSD